MATQSDQETIAGGPLASAVVADPPRPRGYTELGYLFAACAAILFSTKGIAIKLGYAEGVDAEITIALRMALALPIYAFIAGMAVRDRRRRGDDLPNRQQVVKAGLVGLLGYWFASYTDFLGLELITAQFERLILFTYPVFVVLLGAAFFGLPMKMKSLAAIGVSYTGLIFIFMQEFESAGANVAIGGGFVLAAAVAFALYQLLAKRIIADIGPRLFTCIAMSGAALGSFVTFGLTHPLADLVVGQHTLLIMIYLAIGATVLPSFFLSASLHRISAQANATIGTVSPVATIIMAVLILGEPLTATNIAGTALVLAGVGWFTLSDRRERSG